MKPVPRIVRLSSDAAEGDCGLGQMPIVSSEVTAEEADPSPVLAYSTGNAVNESSIRQRESSPSFELRGHLRITVSSLAALFPDLASYTDPSAFYEEYSQMSTSEARHPTQYTSSSSPPIFAPLHGSSATTAQNVVATSLATPPEELSHITNHLYSTFIPGSVLHQNGMVEPAESSQSQDIPDDEVKLEEFGGASTSRDSGQFLKRKHMDPSEDEEPTKRLKL
ncbi:hypothetical protein DL93DRAFT_2088865 [Clavulina sp. PMI_390]|nr:hypothetical protein DL93DRAFT_2088865 [Clavulina sp. PMI_390]